MDHLLADAAAWSHAAFIVFLVAGGVLCLRWPSLLGAHIPAVLGMATVNLLGLDCPFTTVEKHYLERAGQVPYDGGFVSHYLVEPVYPDGITTPVRLSIIAAWVLPTVVSYAVLARRRSAAVQVA